MPNVGAGTAATAAAASAASATEIAAKATAAAAQHMQHMAAASVAAATVVVSGALFEKIFLPTGSVKFFSQLFLYQRYPC